MSKNVSLRVKTKDADHHLLSCYNLAKDISPSNSIQIIQYLSEMSCEQAS